MPKLRQWAVTPQTPPFPAPPTGRWGRRDTSAHILRPHIVCLALLALWPSSSSSWCDTRLSLADNTNASNTHTAHFLKLAEAARKAVVKARAEYLTLKDRKKKRVYQMLMNMQFNILNDMMRQRRSRPFRLGSRRGKPWSGAGRRAGMCFSCVIAVAWQRRQRDSNLRC